jgi:hypothetical protein
LCGVCATEPALISDNGSDVYFFGDDFRRLVASLLPGLPEEEEDLGRHRTVRGRKVVPLGRDLPGFDQGVKGE